jgi:transcription elongation GreA/GreB family factor
LSKILDTASAGDYNSLADLWLETLNGEVPFDDMIKALSILLRNGEDILATELLELTIEERETEGDAGFAGFLFRAAELFHSSEPLRKALVEMVRDDNLMFQPLEHFLKLSGLKKEDADVQSSWKLFQSLMKFRKDGYLYHRTFGIGQISRMSRKYATIDFQKAQNHDMKLDVVLESTVPLASDSLAVLSWRSMDEFLTLFRDSPDIFLERLVAEPLGNPGEIRIHDLNAFFCESEYSESDAWKILKKYAASATGFADLGERIVQLDQGVEFLERIRAILARKKEPVSSKTREIQALLKSCSSSIPETLTDLLRDIKSISSPETGSLFELCWILSDRGTAAKFTGIRGNFLEKNAARAERALGEIRSLACRKDYLELFFSGGADRCEKMKLLSQLRRSLWEHAALFLEKTDPSLLSECIGNYLSKPSETDRFLWALAFLAANDSEWEGCIGENQTGLFLDNLIFSSADTQKKVIHLLMGHLKPELESFLSSIDTRKLGEYLDRFETSATAQNEGLCLLVSREISRRKSSSFGKSTRKQFWESESLFSSLKAIEQLEADILKLKQIDIPAAAEAIGEAASHGDLSENAEYSAAIEKRDLLLAKLNRWSQELRMYRAYPEGEISTETVSPGIRVQIQESGGAEEVQTVDIVGPLDADPDNGRINYMAPIGKVLLGKSTGDMVFLPGDDIKEWRIVSLEILDLVKL